MYGESRITTNVTLTAPTTFAAAQSQVAAGGSLRFSVEEEEMFCALEFQGVIGHSVADQPFDATFFVDGVDVADLVDGITRGHCGAVAPGAGVQVPFFMRKVMRLAQGEHRIEVRFKTAAGNVLVLGLLHPARLSTLRMSHNATLAANMTSKQVTGVY